MLRVWGCGSKCALLWVGTSSVGDSGWIVREAVV